MEQHIIENSAVDDLTSELTKVNALIKEIK